MIHAGLRKAHAQAVAKTVRAVTEIGSKCFVHDSKLS